MKLKIKRKRRSLKTWQIFTILFILLILISTSYAIHTSQLTIIGEVRGEQEEFDVLYLNIDNSSSLPSTVKYMDTYSYTFDAPPTIQNVWMDGVKLSLNTDYTYTNGTLTIPKVTGNLTIEGALLSNYAAEINGTFYTTLQEAVSAVPKDNTETTIKLLKNVSEKITVANNQNINFNLQIYTISNNGNNPVIENNGTIKISNGTITSNAPKNGAINNQATGNITISGGSVIVTGGRQALYNNGGIAEITGNAYLSSVATERAAVQNLNNGKLTIAGGTIISTGSDAVSNNANMTIGIQDGNVSINSPEIRGKKNGVTSTTEFNFYDGIIKGQTKAISDVNKVDGVEEGYSPTFVDETIDGTTYKTSYLVIAQYCLVTFDANGGTVSESTRKMITGKTLGDLPIPIKSGFGFAGWYTSASGGTKINRDKVITEDVTFYAHWSETIVAEKSNEKFATLQEAINSVSLNNVKKTITLLRDIGENVIVAEKQNIEFDLQNYTLSNGNNTNNNNAIIENKGTVTIKNGTILSNYDKSATINNNGGAKLYISGGTIRAAGGRQAIYNNAGTVEISGTAYITSNASENVTAEHSVLERATIQNLKKSTLIITGGTIVGELQQAITNEGTTTLGKKDGNISVTSPVIIGNTHGISNVSTFNFYDGIIKGVQDAISGEINNKENGSEVKTGTEESEGKTYITNWLEITQ